ncbi:uncharacterized protein LOC127614233 [Hippocampus zosterae]|uniref:uncharacterized protein LOC127614233 n=1 Tax=Hippocampus zosterae TaxID=109293 RepID=UPI00223D6FCF|nr:uncharacterized protein LOC127614233 [Hippocampus zosterae]
MCKVESSTDSDSEISPRWSDTSTMECVSSAPESGSLRRMLPRVHEPAGRQGCYSLFLDPYDGSSEDSDETRMDASTPKGQTRQQGKGGRGRISRRTRHFILHPPLSTDFRPLVKQTKTTSQHLLDVHKKRLDDSEVWLCQLSKDMTGSQPAAAGLEAHYRLHDDAQMPDSSLDSTAGPCDVRVVVKRKPDVPCGDSLVLRKRLCVVRVEEEKEG